MAIDVYRNVNYCMSVEAKDYKVWMALLQIPFVCYIATCIYNFGTAVGFLHMRILQYVWESRIADSFPHGRADNGASPFLACSSEHNGLKEERIYKYLENILKDLNQTLPSCLFSCGHLSLERSCSSMHIVHFVSAIMNRCFAHTELIHIATYKYVPLCIYQLFLLCLL